MLKSIIVNIDSQRKRDFDEFSKYINELRNISTSIPADQQRIKDEAERIILRNENLKLKSKLSDLENDSVKMIIDQEPMQRQEKDGLEDYLFSC